MDLFRTSLKKLIYWLIVIAGVLFSLLVFVFLVHLIFPSTRDALFGSSIAQVNKILAAAVSVLIGGIVGTFVGRFLRQLRPVVCQSGYNGRVQAGIHWLTQAIPAPAGMTIS